MRVVIVIIFTFTMIVLPGCMGQAGAHRLGFIPVSGLIGDDPKRTKSPADLDLYIRFPDGNETPADDGSGQPTWSPGKFEPLYRTGYWMPDRINETGWYRDLIDPSKTEALGEAFMIIDVSNLYRYTALGLDEGDEDDFRRRLRKIAEQLLIAADHNGDIYWRNLVADLEAVELYENLSKIFIGSGAGAAFASPAVGAVLTITGLGFEIFQESYVDGLEVNEYASLRESASLYRKAIALGMFKEIDKAKPNRHAVQAVLNHADDYAFTYSIKGSLYAVQKSSEQLQAYLNGEEGSWGALFNGTDDGGAPGAATPAPTRGGRPAVQGGRNGG